MLVTTNSRNLFIPSTQWDDNISRKYVDALGASVWDESYAQTFGYRWRGQDTLTWGNPDEWIVAKWMIQRFLEQDKQDFSNLARQESELSAFIAEMRMVQLETLYHFRNPTEIRNFLTYHRKLLSVLREAHSVVEEFFYRGIVVSLEIVKDPELANAEQLFGYIKIDTLSPEEAFESLNLFDEAWFLKQFDLIGGLLNFNLE